MNPEKLIPKNNPEIKKDGRHAEKGSENEIGQELESIPTKIKDLEEERRSTVEKAIEKRGELISVLQDKINEAIAELKELGVGGLEEIGEEEAADMVSRNGLVFARALNEYRFRFMSLVETEETIEGREQNQSFSPIEDLSDKEYEKLRTLERQAEKRFEEKYENPILVKSMESGNMFRRLQEIDDEVAFLKTTQDMLEEVQKKGVVQFVKDKARISS